jgi:hypothetical protein
MIRELPLFWEYRASAERYADFWTGTMYVRKKPDKIPVRLTTREIIRMTPRRALTPASFWLGQ